MLLGVGVGLAVLGNAALTSEYGFMAMEGGIFHIFNHAMYKGLLFLTAGAIIYRIGTHDLNRMGGLGHTMKYTMIFFIIGALAIAESLLKWVCVKTDDLRICLSLQPNPCDHRDGGLHPHSRLVRQGLHSRFSWGRKL
jgi:hypothetical protein